MSTFTINLEFDYATQTFTNSVHYPSTTWTRTVTSGDIIVGYVNEDTSYDHYSARIFFRVANTDAYAFKLPKVSIKNITTSGYATHDDGSRYSWNPVSYNTVNYYGFLHDNFQVSPSYWNSNSITTVNNYRDDRVALGKYNDFQYVVVELDPAHWGSYYYYGVIHNIENSVLEVTCETLDFIISNIYPIDVNCRNDRITNISWTYNNPRTAEINNQPAYYPTEATITVTQGQTVKTFTTTESDVTCPIPANELTPGEATYKVTLTSNYGYSFDSPEQTFTVIGQTSAPEITNITQNSFPTITWNCADQAAWELLIKDSNSVVYHSDMRAGTEQSYTLPVMLEDGSYSVEMRALNIYGYYTDWGSYGFSLFPEKPTAATNLIVSTNANYTVTIDCTAPEDAGTLYVVRRRTPNEKAIIIGEYNNGFTDYYVPVNTTYEYAVRNYVTGYADTDFIDATIKTPGVVIRDGEDLTRFIPLWKNDNEEFDVIANDSRSDTLVQCLGRKYPVNEVGEWITSTRTFTAHVSASDINKLNDINLNSKCVYLQNKDECIPCKMEINDAGEYNGGGRIINFTLTRIDEEMA